MQKLDSNQVQAIGARVCIAAEQLQRVKEESQIAREQSQELLFLSQKQRETPLKDG